MSFAPVTGDVTCCPSQCSIALFSYVCPSAAMTGLTNNTCAAKGHQEHVGAYSVLNTTNCRTKDLPGGQKHTAEASSGKVLSEEL